MGKVFAAADIGSNTIHLLIADVRDSKVARIENLSEWLSLGKAVAQSGEIPSDKLTLLIQVLQKYSAAADLHKAERVYVFATEAMRVAKNSAEAISKIQKETGISVELISPRREAELSYLGVMLDAPFQPKLLLEVGGGSAQIAFCRENNITREFSLPIGTGRLQGSVDFVLPATPGAVSKLKRIVLKEVCALPKSQTGASAVASGGIARGLIRALHPDGEQRLAVEEVEFLAWDCARLNIDTICKRYSVKAKRATALLPGAIVYLTLMKHLGVSEIFVSEFGVREGAILEMERSAD